MSEAGTSYFVRKTEYHFRPVLRLRVRGTRPSLRHNLYIVLLNHAQWLTLLFRLRHRVVFVQVIQQLFVSLTQFFYIARGYMFRPVILSSMCTNGLMMINCDNFYVIQFVWLVLGLFNDDVSTVDSIVEWDGEWLSGVYGLLGRIRSWPIFYIFLNLLDDKEGNEIFQWADDQGGFRIMELACKNVTLLLH